MNISYENFKQYEDNAPPVVVDYRPAFQGRVPEATAVNDCEPEAGAHAGDVTFTVHAVTGPELETMSMRLLKIKALHHLATGGRALAIGHNEKPESIYENSQLYPCMFPYGRGRLYNEKQPVKLTKLARKRQLLLYHDKCFQCEANFSLIAFNHEQIKSGTNMVVLFCQRKLHFQTLQNNFSTLTLWKTSPSR